jgi:uncharacterized membrane protein YqhA
MDKSIYEARWLLAPVLGLAVLVASLAAIS